MYKLNINKLSHSRVMHVLGISPQHYYKAEGCPPPTKLRRTYKTICKVCNMLSTSYLRGERRSICWHCKMLISKEALRIKIKRDRRKRLMILKVILLWISTNNIHYYNNLSYLTNKVMEYL